MMRGINQKPRQKELSAGRFNPDLYILSYPQNDINQFAQRRALPSALPVKATKDAQQPYCLANTRKESKGVGSVADRWKNIDRLVKMLKRGSKSKDKHELPCSRLFKAVQKMYAKFWGMHSLQIKQIALKRIRTKLQMQLRKTLMPNLKESLEMRENQIQKGSINFEINDLMHIVGLHKDEVNQNKLKKYLSREMINAGSKDKLLASPKKAATNVYILRRKTKEDLSTRQDLNSNNHISSQHFLPNGTPLARSISPHSVDRSKSPNSVNDVHIDLPSARNSAIRDNRLQELEIDSVRLDKSQSNDQQERESISNIKFPSFGMNRPSQMAATRPNRLMNPQMGQKKIVFNYNHHQQASNISFMNQYFPPQTTAKFIIHRQFTPKNIPISEQYNALQPNIIKTDQPVTRLQTTSSLQALHPKSILSNQAEGSQNNQNNPQFGIKDDGSVESRRCYSMPKITFTYHTKPKQDVFFNPTPLNLHKNSPILVLNQLRSNASRSRQQNKEDSYLSKNIQVKNVAAPPNSPQVIHSPRQVVYAANIPPQGYYNMPVNNFVAFNTSNQARTERVKILSNRQTQPTTSFISNQQVRREEYYGSKQMISTHETLPPPNRQRVMSTDTYILSNPKLITPASPKKQDMAYGISYRQRARSCGMKMDVVSRRLSMIRVN